ncbi:MAG: group II intron reverse transcriptase domain-containing protein [Ruminococcus sp.]|nr:group II intron reverse transcriptase domain-containing protein [Ruminococcus sp.]
MSLLDKLSDPNCWERFYEYKTSLVSKKSFTAELRSFIDGKGYLPVCGRISSGESFPLPRRSEISKQETGKKRVIYIYPPAENTVLKLLTHLMLRKYDGCFAGGLYSFRPNHTAQMAVRKLTRTPGIGSMWAYKADISNYFNSVDISLLMPMLEKTLGNDRELYGFLSSLLTEPCVLDDGRRITEQKGIMAGTPISAFCANLYLSELDRRFEALGVPYARYSDDIIVFSEDRDKLDEYKELVHSFLREKGLTVNPDKELLSAPGEGWVFLGLSYKDGIIDIAPASVVKLKAKMRRKTRALMRWQQRSGISPEKAAKAFIRIFERKLFGGNEDNDLTWSYWYFPVINTDRSLRVIDRYAQDCIRYLISGKRTASRFNVRYEDMKQLGLRSLVHEYYSRLETEDP